MKIKSWFDYPQVTGYQKTMTLNEEFNSTAEPLREVVLDIETTGLLTSDGHRIIEVAAIEMIGGVVSDVEFHALVNPERHIPIEVTTIHGIDDAAVKDAPLFSAIAKELRSFIGDAPVVITCRTNKEDGYTLDREFLNMELQKAGIRAVPHDQWLNVRRWSEELFGEKGARLDSVLDYYKISREERDKNGHSAILDARLLAEVYPLLKKDYEALKSSVTEPRNDGPKGP